MALSNFTQEAFLCSRQSALKLRFSGCNYLVKGVRASPWLSGKEIRETRFRREDALEEGLATHCSLLAWKIPWTEELGGLQSMGSKRIEHN